MELSKSLNTILGNNKYCPNNGRINLTLYPSFEKRVAIHDRIEIKNRATDYREPVGGWERNEISDMYYSKSNIEFIQNSIRNGVYKMSGDRKYILPSQNIDALKMIMRTIYYRYAKFNPEFSVKEQVNVLNKHVLDYTIPLLYNEAVGYEKYLYDQSNLVVPMTLPTATDRDYKGLEFKTWF